MRSSMMAGAVVSAVAALAGCSADGNNQFASRDTTVEYYRVFDIKTEATAPAVAKAASEGINRNVKDAVVSTPATVDVAALPGHFKMADPAAAVSAPPGAPAAASTAGADKGPTCEGASWTARAAPHVRGGDNMNIVACLFPYKSGYHLDMYTVFTKPEGGLLYWPRRLGGVILGTPEKFTETTMMDVVRSIHDSTRAQVTLVEAKPTLAGTPWLDNSTAPASSPAPASTPASTPPSTPAATPASSPGAAPAAASAPAAAAPAAPVPAAQSGAQAGAQSGAQSGEPTASTSKQP